ncbi:MAG: helix-turn-helix transcriptional regulator [Polyangiaceae bacterium]|nr:helix-turn-helix transcriptional regulator [Polyangiaceae bacterium]
MHPAYNLRHSCRVLLPHVVPRPLRPSNLSDEGSRASVKSGGSLRSRLAKKTDLIQVLISDYENDKLRPNPDVLVRFAVALDVSTDRILGVAKPDKRGPALSGVSRLLRRLQQFDKLPKRDQDALLRTIDAFLSRGDAA